MDNISIVSAFFAGILSFLSPCVLPLIPSYVSFITGISLKDFSDKQRRTETTMITLINSLAFIAGFTFVFISLGALAGFAAESITTYKDVLSTVGGILVIFFGLVIMGVIKLPFMEQEKRMFVRTKPFGIIGSFLIGCTFGGAWIPCVGPILGSILVIAATKETIGSGVFLLFVYSMGLAIPFLLSSLLINTFLSSFKRITKYMGVITFLSGLLLIIIGLLLITNNFSMLMAPAGL